MVPVNFVSKLVSRPQLLHRLSRNLSTTGELFSCGCRQTRDDCPPKKCETKVPKARRKCKPMESFQSGQVDGKDKGSLPEFCSKTALTEFSWKMKELQKNWDLIATQMEKDCEARGYKKDKDESVKPKAECKVKPPKKEEEKSLIGPILMVLAALAVAAGIAYYLYTESQKKAEGDENKDEKKEEPKDEKKDGK